MVSLTNGAQIPENSILFSVTAAIDNTRTSRPLQLIQYDDTLPVVAVSLTQNSQPWIPPSGATIQVRVGKPDGHFVIADALGVDENGVVYFAVILQMTTAYGLASATLEFTDSGVKNCAPITLEITPNPVSNESIESTDDYQSLVQILQQVQSLASSAEQSQQQAAASEAAAAQSAAEAKAAAESIGIDDSTVSATKLWSSEKSVASFAPLSSALKVSGAGDGLVSLTPTVPWYLQGLKLFGKTTQDGTPSPENPVPLVSAGQSGSLNCLVAANNLENTTTYFSKTENYTTLVKTALYSGIPKGTKVTFSVDLEAEGDTKAYWNRTFYPGFPGDFEVSAGKKRYSVTVTTTQFLPNIGVTNQNVLSKSATGDGVQITASNFCLSVGENAAYISPARQTLALVTPDGLSGLPVASGGNYTDETGQQWLCDEVDFEEGKENVIVKKITIDDAQVTSLTNSRQKNPDYYGLEIKPLTLMTGDVLAALSDKFVFSGSATSINGPQFTNIPSNGYVIVGVPKALIPEETIEAAQNWIKANPIEIQYVIKNSVAESFPIPAETLAAYAALQSYAGTTNILAENCGIEATAIADAQTVIAGITDRLSALEQNAIGG